MSTMTAYEALFPDSPFTLQMAPLWRVNAAQFEELTRQNPDLRMELSDQGAVEMMSPVGGYGGKREMELTKQFAVWCDSNKSGIGFSSNTMFQLPDGSIRSPDAAWISLDRWNQLSEQEQLGFPPLAPEFVVELRSDSDRLRPLQAKLGKYIANGVRLGWLVDPIERRVHIYQPGCEPIVLDQPLTVDASPELPGFVLDCTRFW